MAVLCGMNTVGYNIWLEGYLCTSCLPPAFDDA